MAAESDPAADGGTADRAEGYQPSAYVRALGLRRIEPVGWQRAVLAEGSVVLAILVVLADLAGAWLILVLPLVVAAVVVYHDLLADELRR